MTTFIRHKNSDTFHFEPTCPQYPGDDAEVVEYEGSADRPTYGELCNTCLAIEDEEDDE